MMEIWKRIDGYPEYSVSNLGRVRRDIGGPGKTAGRILKPAPTSNGYLAVGLYRAGERVRTTTIHPLVCAHFHGPRPNGAVARHLNGEKTDNRAANLAWGSHRENAADTAAHGRMAFGSKCKQAKLNPSAVRAIRRQAGVSTYKELGRQYGVSDQAIYRVVAGKSWSHVQ